MSPSAFFILLVCVFIWQTNPVTADQTLQTSTKSEDLIDSWFGINVLNDLEGGKGKSPRVDDVKEYNRGHPVIRSEVSGAVGFAVFLHNDIERNLVRLNVNGQTGQHFFGLFSGHGDARCASYLAENLDKNIFNDEQIKSDTEKAITKQFQRTDKDFLQAKIEHSYLTGSSAVVAVVVNNQTFIANSGDTKAVLCYEGGVVSQTVTQTISTEARRIKKLEGVAIKGTQAIITEERHRFRTIDVSHAFGEEYFKHKKIVVVDPDIKSATNEEADFMILASSDVWDEVKPSKACALTSKQSPSEVAEQLIMRRSTQLAVHMEDDLTAIVVDLKKLKK